MNGQLPRVKESLIAMKTLSISLVAKMQDSVVLSDDFGEIDALKFSAAMRIFCRVAYSTSSSGVQGIRSRHEPRSQGCCAESILSRSDVSARVSAKNGHR
jgi:hypothetical protein